MDAIVSVALAPRSRVRSANDGAAAIEGTVRSVQLISASGPCVARRLGLAQPKAHHGLGDGALRYFKNTYER